MTYYKNPEDWDEKPKSINDKQVGELWNGLVVTKALAGAYNPTARITIRDLIRKLVEERADFYRETRDKSQPLPDYSLEEAQALCDFGIDPEEFNK